MKVIPTAIYFAGSHMLAIDYGGEAHVIDVAIPREPGYRRSDPDDPSSCRWEIDLRPYSEPLEPIPVPIYINEEWRDGKHYTTGRFLPLAWAERAYPAWTAQWREIRGQIAAEAEYQRQNPEETARNLAEFLDN